jgi:hypothetical protein
MVASLIDRFVVVGIGAQTHRSAPLRNWAAPFHYVSFWGCPIRRTLFVQVQDPR